MEIILKKDVEKLGFSNEIVNVKNGYGRNFLIPQGLGVLATESAKKALSEKLKQQAKKDEADIESANKIAKELAKLNVVIKANVAEDGTKLFGSIKISQFTEHIKSLGVGIDSKFVKLPKIKAVGSYTAEVRIHRSVSVEMPFKIVGK